MTPTPVGVFEDPPPEDHPAIDGINIGGSDAARFAHYVNVELERASVLVRRVIAEVP